MNFPSAKDLKRLAAACRKAGIRTFKGEGIEITLTDDAPETKRRGRRAAAAASAPTSSLDPASQAALVEDPNRPSEEAMLFWSVGEAPDLPGPEEGGITS